MNHMATPSRTRKGTDRTPGFKNRFRGLRTSIALAILVAASAVPGWVPIASADHLDELIEFDGTGLRLSEGLIRQRLGLMNADGRPNTTEGGALVSLVSADGKRAGYDMANADNATFANALVELKVDGGVLTIVTHGLKGAIEVNRKLVKGFGAGTGRTEVCLDPPIALADARRNVTVNMVVCSAADDGGGVTAVSRTLSDEIARAGGSVRTMNASRQTLEINMDKSYRAVNGYDPDANPGDRAKLGEALDTRLIGVHVRDRYQTLQTSFDNKVGAGKVVAVIRYRADIVMPGGNVTIQDEDMGFALDETVVTETEGSCSDDCSPTPTLKTTWGAVRALYR